MSNKRNRQVSDWLACLLKAHGVTTLYGVVGGTLMPLVEILRQSGLRFIACNNEAHAVFMAAGSTLEAPYRLGVALTIGGPAAALAISALAIVQAESLPTLLISSEVASGAMGRAAVQDSSHISAIPVCDISRSFTGLSVCAQSAHEVATALYQAITCCLYAGESAHVAIPMDIFAKQEPRVKPSAAVIGSKPLFVQQDIERLCSVLGTSKRPVIFVGPEAQGASTSLHQIGEILGAPLVTTTSGKSAASEFHPLSVGIYSFPASPHAELALRQADVVLCSHKSNDFCWNKFTPPNAKTQILEITSQPCSRHSPVQLQICGAPHAIFAAVAQTLARGTARRPWFKLEGSNYLAPQAMTDHSLPLKPERVMVELQPALLPKMRIAIDVGTATAYFAHYVKVTPDQRTFTPLQWACMGQALPSAIGMRLASRLPTLAIVGDGAFLSTGLCIQCASQEKIGNLVYLVLNNGGHRFVSAGCELHYGKSPNVARVGKFSRPVDICKIANGLGALAIRVNRPGQLGRALRTGFMEKHRPTVIDVRVDPEAIPPIGSRVKQLAAFRG